MTNQDRQPFNTIPHYIAADYRGGKLKINQLRVLLWLRAIGTPYGIATTSLNDLKHDVFPYDDLKINTINSILIKLRQKRHIYFEPRQGKAGTFDIKLNHWLMPNKGYQTLDKYFAVDDEQNNSPKTEPDDTLYPQAESSEDHQKLEGQNQKLREMKSGLIKGMSVDSQPRQIRSYHNEHDTEHQIENHQNESKAIKRVVTADYEPGENAERRRCKQIALAVGDPYMNFILSALKNPDGGIEVIEDGYEQFCEAKRNYEDKGEPVSNPPALFNRCVTAIIEGNRYERETKEDL